MTDRQTDGRADRQNYDSQARASIARAVKMDKLFSCRLSTSSSTALDSRDEGKMPAVEQQERYAFSRRSGYDSYTYGGCQSRFPTAVELQLQPAAVLGAGVPGAAVTRTRVVPVTSPGGGRSSSSPC